MCAVSSLCPVYFTSQATLRLTSTTLAIPSQPTHTGRESVDQWSRVPAGTVVEQIAPIAAVMNATSVHSLQRTTPNPLSCPGFTPCISSQSPRTILRSPVPTTPMWARLTIVASHEHVATARVWRAATCWIIIRWLVRYVCCDAGRAYLPCQRCSLTNDSLAHG